MRNFRFLTICLAIATVLSLSLSAQTDTVHKVADGETLYSIARRYHMSVDELRARNGNLDPAKLRPGMTLQIGSQPSHKVAEGETLYGIARKYSISPGDLAKQNGLSIDARLRIGMVLEIPGAALQPAASPARSTATPRVSQPPANVVVSTPKPSSIPTATIRNDISWPHNGERSRMTGRISGVRMEGKPGDAVRCVANGTVAWTGPYRGYGLVVIVQNASGFSYVYGGHGELRVNVGDVVRPGQVLGILGSNLYERTYTAYFFVYKNGNQILAENAPRI